MWRYAALPRRKKKVWSRAPGRLVTVAPFRAWRGSPVFRRPGPPPIWHRCARDARGELRRFFDGVRLAVGAGGLAGDLLERAQEVVLRLEAADLGDLLGGHLRRGQEALGVLDAERAHVGQERRAGGLLEG